MHVTGPTGGADRFAHDVIRTALMKWLWPSRNPGSNVLPARSIIVVPGPRVARTSVAVPTARIRPPAIASASAEGEASLIVMMSPLVKMVSAMLIAVTLRLRAGVELLRVIEAVPHAVCAFRYDRRHYAPRSPPRGREPGAQDGDGCGSPSSRLAAVLDRPQGRRAHIGGVVER